MGLFNWCSKLNRTYMLIGILIILIIILLLLNSQKANIIYGGSSSDTLKIEAPPVVSQETKPVSTSKEGFSDEKPRLVLYYASWCGWCKRLKAPDGGWAQLKKSGKLDNKVELVEVQCDVENPPEKAKSISGYPTIMLEKDGKDIPYEGDRSKESFVDFVNKHI
jgi:thiol-disulfide isomerase/thioredoxin